MKARKEQFPGKTREERESCIPAFGHEESRAEGHTEGRSAGGRERV